MSSVALEKLTSARLLPYQHLDGERIFPEVFRGRTEPTIPVFVPCKLQQAMLMGVRFSQDTVAAGTLEPGLSVISAAEKWFESSKMQSARTNANVKQSEL